MSQTHEVFWFLELLFRVHLAFLVSGVFPCLDLQPSWVWVGVGVALKASDRVRWYSTVLSLTMQATADHSRGQVLRAPQMSSGRYVPRRD